MGYVGRGLNQDGGQYRKLDSIATSFNGSETNFTLTIDGLEVTPTAQNLMISLGGVIQEPGTAFTVNGSTITFASAPADATTFFGVLMGEATFIARGTVGAAEMGITAGAVSASAGVVVDSSKNVIGFNEISASIFKGSFSGDTSSSINTRINSLVTDSGSFSTRITNATASINSISSSQATRTANLVIASSSLSASVATLKGSGTLQSVATNASPTFAGATITGTLTAQEIHTEFESASILFTSGSTQFGNSSDDVHDFKGNTISGSATSTGSFGSAHFRGVGGVGIGTNNPTVALEVFGSADQQIRIDSTGNRAQLQFDGKKTSDAEFAEINFANDGDSAAAIHAMRDGANDAARLAFFTQATGGSVTERMSVDSTGLVGIGTATPLAKLHVEHTTDDTDENGNIALTVGGGSSGDVRHYWGVNNSSNYAYYGAVEHATQYVPLVLQPNGSNVGIGTATVSSKLHIDNAIDQFSLFIDSNYRENTRFHSTETNQGTRVLITNGSLPNSEGYGFAVGDGGNHRMTIGQFNSNGSFTTAAVNISGSHVGIGTTVPASELDVYHASEPRLRIRRGSIYTELAQNSSGFVMTGDNSDGNAGFQISAYGDSFIGKKGGNFAVGSTAINRGGMQKTLEVIGGHDLEVSMTATGSLVDDQRIGQIAWYTNTSQYNMACIIGRVSGTDENRGELTFHTRYTESGGTPTERWRMKSTGTFEPGTNNAVNLGATDKRVSVIYTSNSVNVSDRTLKENITASDLGLTFIDTLQPKSFNMKDLTEAHDDYGRRHHGLIAQDLLDTPLSGSVFGDKDGEYSLAYNDLIGPMIKAIQELSTEVQSLKAQVSGSN